MKLCHSLSNTESSSLPIGLGEHFGPHLHLFMAGNSKGETSWLTVSPRLKLQRQKPTSVVLCFAGRRLRLRRDRPAGDRQIHRHRHPAAWDELH